MINRDEISRLRRSYGESGLVESELKSDPIAQFRIWLAEAVQNPMIVEANAMVLSTSVDSQPSSRTVLLKDVTDSGFSFFTNYDSAKSRALGVNSKLSLLFPWYPMERQVIIEGSASRLTESESAAYFATRPWASQIGAWASDQSQPLESRELLESRWREFAERYPEGQSVPKPPNWGGFQVAPSSIEFWQGRYSRLHDRIRFTLTDIGWKVQRFFP